jgi:Ca2+-transporting ATPase
LLLLLTPEYKSEKTMEALKRMTAPTSRVIRGTADCPVEVLSSKIVPGDLVLLSQGDRIPAGASSPHSLSLVRASVCCVRQRVLT